MPWSADQEECRTGVAGSLPRDEWPEARNCPFHGCSCRSGRGQPAAGIEASNLTVNLNSVRDLLAGTHRVSGPPHIPTWNWPAAKESVAVLAGLEPALWRAVAHVGRCRISRRLIGWRAGAGSRAWLRGPRA